MKTNRSSSISARVSFALLLFLCGVALICLIPFIGTRAQSLSSGSVNSNGTGSNLTWNGTTVSAGGNTSEDTCMDSGVAKSCETYVLTVNGAVTDWAGKKIQVLLDWNKGNPTDIGNEYDIYIHKGTSTSGPLVTSAIQGPGLTSQVAFIDPSSAGVGAYTIHVAYDTTPTSATDEYQGTISVQSVSSGGSGITPAVPDTADSIGYELFEAPGTLQTATSTSSGAVTVEYMGRNAGEPSVGANFSTAVINFQSDLETLFVSFDDSCNLSNPKATWVNRRAPTQQAIDSDPIGFTDRQTGRVFTGSLTLLSPDTPKVSYTDNDGVTWVPAPFMQGLASAVDHESIGGGPYHSPLPSNLPAGYPNAVYYCSQDIATAFCARSDGGGAGVGAQTPLYTLTQCGGLHGHVKVAPDGTAYVPNRACGSNVAAVVSTDNGTSWTVQPVQNTSVTTTPSGGDDPAIGIDAAGKVYFLFSYNGTTPVVAMSTDQGQSWPQMYDLGAALGIKNVAFPAAVGGDAGRAAVAFYGSTTAAGDSSADTFPGVWQLYVAHTFDGGNTWTTTDVTPSLPMQRMGLLRGGGGPVDRNLLDFFDITMDRDGRVVVGFVNGCSGGPCSQAASSATGNAYTTTATIARQSSGRRLLQSKDPGTLTSVPGMPFVTAKRSGSTVTLAWNQSDTGSSPILTSGGYDIYRGTTSGGETHLATVNNVTSFTDSTATDVSKTYYYRVVANNAVGSSCANNEIAVPYVGDTCSGLIIHRNLPTHPEATGNGPFAAATTPTPAPSATPFPTPLPLTPQLTIDYIAAGEPPNTGNTTTDNRLMFKMKVTSLSTLPPNSRWRIVWDWPGTAANPNVDEQYFIGMTTDQSSTPTFEYGTLQTTSLVVVGVPTENPLGAADSDSNYNPDGTITLYIPKSKVGSPAVGDLLGAVNGRTFATGDTAGNTLERSTLLVDHTFVKGNTDNSFPPATYAIVGNTTCAAANIVPIGAVSRKTHGTAGTFDIDLPLLGNPGIEDRSGGANKNFQVVVTFDVPVTLPASNGVTVTPGGGGTASVASYSVNNTTVTINLTNVSNQQTLSINLMSVHNGSQTNDVSIPMGMLLGDATGNGRVDGTDVSTVQGQNRAAVTNSNFRDDVTANGKIDGTDVSTVQAGNRTSLR